MASRTVSKYIAIQIIPCTKVDASLSGGIARAAQRTEVAVCELVLDYELSPSVIYKAGSTKAILPGEAAFAPWNKKEFVLDGKKFVLCPVDMVIGWQT